MTEIEQFKNIELQKVAIDDVSFGLRQTGKGEDLIFIHGFPTHGYTWRKIIPELSKHYRCHILDLPGLGDSDWSIKTDFNIAAQAKKIQGLISKLNLERCSLIAHNSGGTIARIVAMNAPSMVKHLILINTEIPNHRPPFIELYQRVGLLPFMSYYLRKKLNQQRFVRSSMGFQQAYSDKAMFDDDSNLKPYLQPLIDSNKKTKGAFKYLKGIDWKIIDGFEKRHQEITANVLFLWGEEDRTFPIDLGKKMTEQFECALEFKAIKNARLLPHEEQPDEIVIGIKEFMKKYE